MLSGRRSSGAGRSGATGGVQDTLMAHPHWMAWMQLEGLIRDGVNFTLARSVRGGAGYQAVRSSNTGEGGGEPKGSKAKSSVDRGGPGPSPKKEKKEKKEKAEKEKRGRGPAATDSAPAAAAPAPAGTSAGDGGRWVHVPT